MSKRENYYGGNATRGSILQNPSAWVGKNTEIFGVAEFRKYGFASDAVKDLIAEKEMSKGYSKKKNKMCERCNVMKSVSGVCMCD